MAREGIGRDSILRLEVLRLMASDWEGGGGA
jgi:hypothetical protein